MTRTAIVWATILAASAASPPALAQMGGSMMGGSSGGDSSSPFNRNELSSGDKKKWALCQKMTPEAMAEDKKCAYLQKKIERSQSDAR